MCKICEAIMPVEMGDDILIDFGQHLPKGHLAGYFEVLGAKKEDSVENLEKIGVFQVAFFTGLEEENTENEEIPTFLVGCKFCPWCGRDLNAEIETDLEVDNSEKPMPEPEKEGN